MTENTGSYILHRRKELGILQSEVAKYVGVTEATVSRWESGEIKNMKRNNIYKLAKILQISPLILLDDTVSAGQTAPSPDAPPSCKGIRIPVLGKVVAGIPIEAVEDIIDYEEIDEKLAKSGTFFALQIKGRSMEPTFHEGDVVIVRQQPEVENGEIAIVLVNGSEATVKEVKESSDGITLIGHNVAAYTPTFYSRQEVADLPVQIIGKVVELRRKF